MDELVGILRAAGEPTRLRLLSILVRGELTVTELTQVLGQSQPRISRHLKQLVEAGLLERKPEGSWAFYRLAAVNGDGSRAAELATLLARMANSNEDRVLARDAERLEAVKAARSTAAESYFRENAQRWNSLRTLHIAEDAVERALLELAGPGPFAHFVDVGTGTGRSLQLFASRIRKGTGIDTSHEMLTLARTQLDRPEYAHCEVRYGDIFALPFSHRAKDGSGAEVDLILIHQVLHYLAEPGTAIAEAARILVPGGKLLIADFAPHGIEQLRAQHAHRRLGFSEDEVGSYLAAAGLKVDAVKQLEPPPTDEERLTVTLWRASAP
jgi:ArsR family transcriptional regulator